MLIFFLYNISILCLNHLNSYTYNQVYVFEVFICIDTIIFIVKSKCIFCLYIYTPEVRLKVLFSYFITFFIIMSDRLNVIHKNDNIFGNILITLDNGLFGQFIWVLLLLLN